MLRVWTCASVVAVIILSSAQLLAQYSPDPGIPDTVRIDCPIEVPTVAPGDSFRIPIYIWTDYPISGFGIGIKHNYDYVVVESIDTTGSAFDDVQLSFLIDAYIPAERHAYIGWVPFHPSYYFPPAAGDTGVFVFALNMKVLPGAAQAVIDLDSAYAEPAREFVMAVDTGSGPIVFNISFKPQYTDCGTEDIFLGLPNCGDADVDGLVNISDVVYLISYIFGIPSGPEPTSAADVDCGGTINITDAVYLIAYLFGGGPAPCDPNGDGTPDC
jgi:hypothetical protein